MRIIILLGLIVMSFAQPLDEKIQTEENDPRAIIEKIKIYVMTKRLDLTTYQAMQLFPELNELQKHEQDFRKKEVGALAELRSLLKGKASNQAILNVIQVYEDAYNKKMENDKKKFTEIKKILSPVQQAKYLIFREDFENEIRSMIKEIKRQRQSEPEQK